MAESATAALIPIELLVLILMIATGVSIIARRAALPYSVALVLAGLVIAILQPIGRVEVTQELILIGLIPGLVFEAAYKIDVSELRRTFLAVAVLAAPGVLITAAVVAVIVSMVTGMDFGLAFLLGAMISATDPVAVVALFKRVGAPPRLATVVEAESLLNDGTGIVLFTIALGALTAPVSLAGGAVAFVTTIVSSAVLGLIGGLVAFRVMRATDDHMIEVAISFVAAYATYIVADRVHESGVIATVVVGLVLGNQAGVRGLSQGTRDALDVVWEFTAFVLTAVTFLLVGFAISPDLLLLAAPVIAAGFVAITLARAIVVYGVVGGGSRLIRGPNAPSVGYLHVMFWAGLRGAIAVALALALPPALKDRDLLTGAVYGIVLVTLLVQGTTAGWVIRRSGVLAEDVAPGGTDGAPSDPGSGPGGAPEGV
ncbi:MAG: sodium:proton antiporter [Candidatus Limnocylindrales bacterium]